MNKKMTRVKIFQCLAMLNLANELGNERAIETIAIGATNGGGKMRALLSQLEIMKVGWQTEERMDHHLDRR